MRHVTLVPSNDVTVHVVLGDFGKLGPAWIEIAEDSADEDSIVEGILCGEFTHPLRVVAFNTEEGWSRDVSEDIAMKLVAAARDGGRELRAGAREFVERATGRDVSELA
jgi:hypothetical protein